MLCVCPLLRLHGIVGGGGGGVAVQGTSSGAGVEDRGRRGAEAGHAQEQADRTAQERYDGRKEYILRRCFFCCSRSDRCDDAIAVAVLRRCAVGTEAFEWQDHSRVFTHCRRHSVTCRAAECCAGTRSTSLYALSLSLFATVDDCRLTCRVVAAAAAGGAAGAAAAAAAAEDKKNKGERTSVLKIQWAS
jgi:hypothetical protein